MSRTKGFIPEARRVNKTTEGLGSLLRHMISVNALILRDLLHWIVNIKYFIFLSNTPPQNLNLFCSDIKMFSVYLNCVLCGF